MGAPQAPRRAAAPRHQPQLPLGLQGAVLLPGINNSGYVKLPATIITFSAKTIYTSAPIVAMEV